LLSPIGSIRLLLCRSGLSQCCDSRDHHTQFDNNESTCHVGNAFLLVTAGKRIAIPTVNPSAILTNRIKRISAIFFAVCKLAANRKTLRPDLH
jgi:hypothetical protein